MGSRNLRLLAGAAFALSTIASSLGLAQQAAGRDDATKLNQGWSEQDRLQYYHTSQGSAASPYDIFVNLEAADTTDLFRSNKVAESYGLIPQPADPTYNPDDLPIGVDHTKVADGRWKGEWAGITCAACHTGELHYKGKRIRVDGGLNTGFDFGAFTHGLDDAQAAAVSNPEKFERLAARLSSSDATAKAALRTRLEQAAAGMHHFTSVSMVTQSAPGPARIDAVGEVHNYMITVM